MQKSPYNYQTGNKGNALIPSTLPHMTADKLALTVLLLPFVSCLLVLHVQVL